jgi:catechol 2,3-dioxygenase-like lactoylglutathione lyase family enzyme
MASSEAITGVYEACLYVPDLVAADRFYAGVLGLRRLPGLSDRGLAYRLNTHSVLLILDPHHTRLPSDTVPSHGCDGQGHVAFAISSGQYDAWKSRLTAAGFEIEREARWSPGGRSIYVRDPAGNSVDLVEGQVWPA